MSCFIAAMVIDNREWRWSIFENLLVNVLLRIVTVMPPLHSSSMDVLGGSGLRIDFLLSNLISKFQWLDWLISNSSSTRMYDPWGCSWPLAFDISRCTNSGYALYGGVVRDEKGTWSWVLRSLLEYVQYSMRSYGGSLKVLSMGGIMADHDSGEVGDMGRGLGSQQGLYATRIE
ncbi:hypothetical protein V6N11_013803 [Hibiscus sabdariffa]|uniref:Uncharacterized protein n=1 Tax=Hibiscus sabdariffa TaxID=183260 RepID=A0ABR2PD09_9ROSI